MRFSYIRAVTDRSCLDAGGGAVGAAAVPWGHESGGKPFPWGVSGGSSRAVPASLSDGTQRMHPASNGGMFGAYLAAFALLLARPAKTRLAGSHARWRGVRAFHKFHRAEVAREAVPRSGRSA